MVWNFIPTMYARNMEGKDGLFRNTGPLPCSLREDKLATHGAAIQCPTMRSAQVSDNKLLRGLGANVTSHGGHEKGFCIFVIFLVFFK